MVPVQLKEIKEKVEAGKRINKVSVRTLVSWFWNSQRRGTFVVYTIRQALRKLGLETFPDFASAYIDTKIEFRLIPKKEKSIKKIQKEELIQETSTDNTINEYLNIDDPTYRISRLEAANKKLVFVKPDSTLSEAITLMIANDFSQLPVMQSEKRDLKGVVSWKSIGQKLAIAEHTKKVRDLMETNINLILDETSLFKALPLIIEHDYVLVRSKSNEICGIITASDLSLQFKQLTEPFLLVSEIENHLRQILIKLPKQELENAKDPSDDSRKIESIINLTFGEYVRLFENPIIWHMLILSIDRKTFCEYLTKIRNIRNTIMHFDPDGLEDENVEILRNFVRLLQTLRDLKSF